MGLQPRESSKPSVNGAGVFTFVGPGPQDGGVLEAGQARTLEEVAGQVHCDEHWGLGGVVMLTLFGVLEFLGGVGFFSGLGRGCELGEGGEGETASRNWGLLIPDFMDLPIVSVFCGELLNTSGNENGVGFGATGGSKG